ncbi:6562_t:CDS:2 [Gigaspora margarita]|uniref:6562_t:CDS:1 n=1 Tax=Gigaspora margarita TaxID=4874 RepID=A0ABN7UWL3_GIGMA|nr:6562_t:CDS:2 [Gigaspora margarita]
MTASSCKEESQQASDLETRFASQGSNALFSTGLDHNNYNYYNDDDY